MFVCVPGSWCIYEQYKAGELDIRVSMILPQDQLDSITTEINKGKHGIQTIKTSLTNIKVEDSKASVKKDGTCSYVLLILAMTTLGYVTEVKVKDQIRNTVGFTNVNTAVKKSIQLWSGPGWNKCSTSVWSGLRQPERMCTQMCVFCQHRCKEHKRGA